MLRFARNHFVGSVPSPRPAVLVCGPLSGIRSTGEFLLYGGSSFEKTEKPMSRFKRVGTARICVLNLREHLSNPHNLAQFVVIQNIDSL
jgi:hypothetical protein